ncbi:MAG: lysoplasmalogenase [Acidimicrobiales bacterium]|jgi:uncharacterized membrane protein YhhN
MFVALIVATAVVAAADWWAVGTDNRRAEYVFKPLTMVVLIAATLVLSDPVSDVARWAFVAALVFSLLGDVFLMLEDHFVEGLASFGVGHLCYIVGLGAFGLNWLLVGVGVVMVISMVFMIGRPVVRGAGEHDARLTVPVAAYMTVISIMVAAAWGTAVPIALVGALLFYGSDACIGWSRFVAPFPHHRLWIITTYHLGQIGLVLALAT